MSGDKYGQEKTTTGAKSGTRKKGELESISITKQCNKNRFKMQKQDSEQTSTIIKNKKTKKKKKIWRVRVKN